MKQVLAWALYDLANTFFAVGMLSFYFPLWLVEEQGQKEIVFSAALAISTICVALLMPFCGAVSDAAGERMRFLRWTTYGCVLATAAIAWTPGVPAALLLFGVANVCYQLGTVFYDALLWKLVPDERLGPTSGVGASFGYLGSALGLLLLWPFVSRGGHAAAFTPTALYFLVFALPSFALIREPRQPRPLPLRVALRAAWMRLVVTFRAARSYTGLWRFFWASFFSLNAINTVLVFMGVYTKRVLGFSEYEVIRFFVFSQLFAVAGSVILTRRIPRWGAKRVLAWIWTGWLGALVLIAAGAGGPWLWVAGPAIGFCLGATWATSRVLVMELAPKDQLAEMFGLAGLFGRAASVVGPLLWGLIVLDPSRYRHAVMALILLLAVGLWLLRRV